MSQVAEACACIEANDPPIRRIYVLCILGTYDDEEPEPLFEIKWTDAFGMEYEYNEYIRWC
jgi:hypothetical protein